MKMGYKDYIYLRIPKEKWEKIIEGEFLPSKEDLKAYRFNYELNQLERRANAKRANKIKRKKTLLKIIEALEYYYGGLFKEEKKLTPYKLSQIAKVDFRTAKKFWERYEFDEWIEEFIKNPERIKDFKNYLLSHSF